MIRRYISYLAAGLIFISAGFLTGYFIGVMFCGKKSNASVSAEEQISESIVLEQTPETVKYDMYYMLKFDNDRLCIYEVSGAASRLVRTLKSNIDMYPEMDRKELRQGIIKNTLDEALETAENFTN